MEQGKEKRWQSSQSSCWKQAKLCSTCQVLCSVTAANWKQIPGALLILGLALLFLIGNPCVFLRKGLSESGEHYIFHSKYFAQFIMFHFQNKTACFIVTVITVLHCIPIGFRVKNYCTVQRIARLRKQNCPLHNNYINLIICEDSPLL